MDKYECIVTIVGIIGFTACVAAAAKHGQLGQFLDAAEKHFNQERIKG